MVESRVARADRSIVQWSVYWSVRTIALAVLKIFFRLKRIGIERLPRTGPVLLVANHQSYLDPPMIGVSVPRQFHPIGRAGLFVSPVFAWLLRMLNTMPIREDGRGDADAMKRALAILEQGEVVLIFPEGSRSANGEIGEFKRGASLLLKRSGCPVVPVAIEGAFDAWPRSRKFPILFRCVRVRFGDPIPHDELLADGAEAALERLRMEVIRLRDELRMARKRNWRKRN